LLVTDVDMFPLILLYNEGALVCWVVIANLVLW